MNKQKTWIIKTRMDFSSVQPHFRWRKYKSYIFQTEAEYHEMTALKIPDNINDNMPNLEPRSFQQGGSTQVCYYNS